MKWQLRRRWVDAMQWVPGELPWAVETRQTTTPDGHVIHFGTVKGGQGFGPTKTIYPGYWAVIPMGGEIEWMTHKEFTDKYEPTERTDCA